MEREWDWIFLFLIFVFLARDLSAEWRLSNDSSTVKLDRIQRTSGTLESASLPQLHFLSCTRVSLCVREIQARKDVRPFISQPNCTYFGVLACCPPLLLLLLERVRWLELCKVHSTGASRENKKWCVYECSGGKKVKQGESKGL